MILYLYLLSKLVISDNFSFSLLHPYSYFGSEIYADAPIL